MRLLIVYGVLIYAACGPTSSPTQDSTGLTSTSSSSTALTDATPTGMVITEAGSENTIGTTTTTSVGGSSSSDNSTHSSTPSGEGAASSVGDTCESTSCKVDVGTQFECDPFTQDCPRDQKCAPVYGDVFTWECVPLVEDPSQVGESCVVLDPSSESPDNCAVGSICLDLDIWNPCIPLCTGSAENSTCSDLNKNCGDFAEIHLWLCYPSCNPIESQCPPNTVCAPGSGGFLCAPDFNGIKGKQHDPCSGASDCNQGLACVSSDTAIECNQNGSDCCEPLCDLNAPNPNEPCSGESQECTSFYPVNQAPSGLEAVGICKTSL